MIIGEGQWQANWRTLADKLHEEEFRIQNSEFRIQNSEFRIQKKDPQPDPLSPRRLFDPAYREREEEEGLRLGAREAIIGG